MIESQIVRYKGASDNLICKSISERIAGLARVGDAHRCTFV